MKKILLLTLLAAGFASQAKGGAAAVADEQSDWCAQANIGHAWSLKSGFANPDTTQFQAAVSTETDDAKLGKSSVVGLSLSRNLWSWLSAGVSYDMYSGFEYELTHAVNSTALTSNEILDGTTSYRREFSLSHKSAMFNINVMLPEDWAVSVAGMNVSPVLGVGVGIGISEMGHFQTLNAGLLAMQALDNSKASLAYQANGGLNFQPEDSNMSFGVNYRYYYGGKFESGTSYLMSASTTAAGSTLKAWSGKLKTHQVRLNLNLEF